MPRERGFAGLQARGSAAPAVSIPRIPAADRVGNIGPSPQIEKLGFREVPPSKPQRKVTTQWHPVWKLEARRAEPKLITTTVYNGQSDPLTQESQVICAPTAPALPDGSKIAVVCRRYEQATADETGNLGFTAVPLDKRSWSYQYNQYGQVTQEKDPRGKLTTYAYWSATSFPDGVKGHWLGDLKTVTKPMGQATQYLQYNKRGQATQIQQPNGMLEQREYHLRGWLTKVTLRPAGAVDAQKDQVTQYDYYATGLLKQATQPDGSWAQYAYDAAHRLTDVADSAGNSVHYVLDNAGNRTAEQFKDPSGALAKTVRRTFDALGRMSTTTGLH
jgi:YD repeat-containing protein